MEEEQSNHWESKHVNVTKTNDSEVVGFDTERFKKDYPELFKTYIKTSNRKGYIKIMPVSADKDAKDGPKQ
jgi:hypothetical protein